MLDWSNNDLLMKTFSILALVLLVSTFSVSQSRANVHATGDEENISISLKGIDGKKYDISKMRGEFLVVAFGATWCQPCHEELRDLEVLHLEFKDRPVKFMWISLDEKDVTTDEELRRFAKQIKFTFPILRDPNRDAYKQFSKRQRLPLLVVFNTEGKVVPPNQFGANSQPGVFRITFRNRLKDLFASIELAGSSEGKQK
jgi:peroxiredoxin